MLVSMLIPLFGDSYALMLVSFAFLGVGNAVLGRTVIPLLCDIFYSDSVSSVYNSGLTVMSFTKLSAPLIAPWGAMHIAMTYGLGWRVVFLIYAVVCLLALISVVATRNIGFSHIRSLYIDFSLLRRPSILQYFIGEVCISGMYVGIFVFAPIILNERLGLDVNSAVFGAAIFCLGCIVSMYVISYLAKSISERLQYVLGLLLMGSGLLMLLLCGSQSMLYMGLFLTGCGNTMSDLMHSQAAKVVDRPASYLYDTFELCSVGRVIFPLLMGAVAEVSGVSGAVLVVCAAFVYLLFLAFKVKN